MEYKTVRCKFVCQSKREYLGWDKTPTPNYDYSFNVVSSGSDENKLFWHYTPAGTLNVTTVKDGTFKIGKSYYIDLIEAE